MNLQANWKSTTAFQVVIAAVTFTVITTAGAAPGELDPNFGRAGVLNLNEATGQRIPVPDTRFFPASGGIAGALVLGPGNRIYVGGGFSKSTFVARVLANGILDPTFSNGGLAIRSGFLANRTTTDLISVLPTGKIVTSDRFFQECGTLCPGGSPASGRIAGSFESASTVEATFAAGTPVLSGRDVVTAAAAFKDGGVVALSRLAGLGFFVSGVSGTALRSDGQRDLPFERNARESLACETQSVNIQIFVASVDPQDRLVVAMYYNDVVSPKTICVVRLNRDGRRDTTFGVDGLVKFTDAITTPFMPAAIAFAADGAIRLALLPQFSGPDLARSARAGQIRLTATGRPDGRFADGTIITFDTLLASDLVAIQPLADGNSIVAGYLTGSLLATFLTRPAVSRMIGALPDKGFGPARNGVAPLFDVNTGFLITPKFLAASEVDGGIFVLNDTANLLAKLQGTPAPSAPRYEGLWWRSPAGSESGWGLNLTHQGDILFAAWFTYDLDGSGMWLVMTNGVRVSDKKFTGSLYRTTGAAFSAVPYNPALFQTTEVGSATFEFSDADNGTFSYSVNGIAQSKPITRQVFGALPNCTAGGPAGFLANYQGLWWNAPSNSESGWGINLTHQSDTLFAAWFTYGPDGKGIWLVMTNGARTGDDTPTYTGVLYRTSGPPFNATPWLSEKVVLSPAGTATFSFSDANSAQFSYVVDGISQRKPLTRQIFASAPTVCR